MQRTRVAGVKGAEINPIVYLHAPETGSGFATTVAHHACGSDSPDNVAVLEPSEFIRTWGTACDQTRFGRSQSGHDPLEVTDDSEWAHVVVMVRDPSQRVLSGLSAAFTTVKISNAKIMVRLRLVQSGATEMLRMRMAASGEIHRLPHRCSTGVA